jgi:hypothetical protein
MEFEYDPADSETLKALLNPQTRGGEKRLMLAILESALDDLEKYASAKGRKGRALYEAAEEWILDTASDWFYSFNNVCETLALSPDQVRRALVRRQQTRQKAA